MATEKSTHRGAGPADPLCDAVAHWINHGRSTEGVALDATGTTHAFAMLDSLEKHRVRPGYDIFVVPNFAQDVLGFDPALVQQQLEVNYPVRNAGDAIVTGAVQWVDGDNEALMYRGNILKRGKIWLQRPSTREGCLRYGYTGWQWKVLPATAGVEECKEVQPIADAYDKWATVLGYPKANHYIITKYQDGQHNIGFHSDKANDIVLNSLITIVKTGSHGRLFELCFPGEENTPFFSQTLAPGTAVIMTLEANLQTKHGVPVVAEAKPSGSIVFRTVSTLISPEQVGKELRKRTRQELLTSPNGEAPSLQNGVSETCKIVATSAADIAATRERD